MPNETSSSVRGGGLSRRLRRHWAADEAEEFQAVAMRCRECLLTLVRSTADESMVPVGTEAPKAVDFLAWSGLIAAHVAKRRLRAYLRSTAGAAWDLVNWLTHETNATAHDTRIAIEATGSVLTAFGAAILRHERGMPERCPACRSYRVAAEYRPRQISKIHM